MYYFSELVDTIFVTNDVVVVVFIYRNGAVLIALFRQYVRGLNIKVILKNKFLHIVQFKKLSLLLEINSLHSLVQRNGLVHLK